MTAAARIPGLGDDARLRLRVPARWTRLLRPALRRAPPAGAGREGPPFYVVGGCVRDWLLRRPTKDLDLVTEGDAVALAKACLRLWGGRLEEFDRFGTLRMHCRGGLRVDFVRARAESYAAPAALPVVRPGALSEDLKRRDFTINAMAAAAGDDGTATLVDPCGGRADLAEGVLRALHAGSFRDDPTRLFRAARFAARFGFRLDAATDAQRRRAIREGVVGRLSRERLRAELLRILEEKDPEPALRALLAWELARYLHPRLAWPAGVGTVRGVHERLGVMAMKMGPAGAEFVRSLNLERPVSQALHEALEIVERRIAPRSELGGMARRVLRAHFALAGGARRPAAGARPGAAALKPLLIGGSDLLGLGLPSGPAVGKWLGRAARAQWIGEFSTRSGALRWLRARLASRVARFLI